MNIKFAKGIDVVIENKHIQGLSGVKSNDSLNDTSSRRYDDFSKIPDILKKKMSDYKTSNDYRMEMMSNVF